MSESPRRAEGQEAPAPRLCKQCGLRALRVQSVADLGAVLRELSEQIGPRRVREGENEEARRRAAAEYDSNRATHAWVSISLLADDCDGICVFCARPPEGKP